MKGYLVIQDRRRVLCRKQVSVETITPVGMPEGGKFFASLEPNTEVDPIDAWATLAKRGSIFPVILLKNCPEKFHIFVYGGS